MDDRRVFFPALNELRACAAISVLFAHIEIYKYRDGRPSLYDTPLRYFISHLGESGVHLFFVLSGFLITFLLLEEAARQGRVALSKFYLRRVLRIWPLYYLLVAVGFLIVPAIASSALFQHEAYYQSLIQKLVYGSNLTLHLGLFSNLALLLYPPVVAASQSWSVSVEEQFYLIWPILLRTFQRRPLVMLLAVLSLKLLLTLGVARLVHYAPGLKTAALFLAQLKIELMAIGGIAALWLRNDRLRVTQWASLPLVGAGLAVALAVQLLVAGHYLSLGVCFALLILVTVTRGFQNRWLDRLGVISYGVYMYHPLCMFVGFALVHSQSELVGPSYQASCYFVVVALTLLLSAASFTFFEQPFLRLKSRLSPVPSGSR